MGDRWAMVALALASCALSWLTWLARVAAARSHPVSEPDTSFPPWLFHTTLFLVGLCVVAWLASSL